MINFRNLFYSSILALMLVPVMVAAQSNASRPVTIHIEKDVIPPQLTILQNSILFSDADGNNTINADETSSITMQIKNEGKGDAYGCTAQISAEGNTDGISYSTVSVPIIKSGETVELTFPINSSTNTVNGKVRFNISISEPNGFAPDPVHLLVNTHKKDYPFVEVVSYKLVSENQSELKKKKPFKLQLLVQNTDYGVARDVTCSFKTPNGLYLTSDNSYVRIDSLLPNEKHLIEYELVGNANVADELNLNFDIKESYGRFAKDADIKLLFGQAIHSEPTEIVVQGKKAAVPTIEKGSLISEVDENIPSSDRNNPNTIVLIIANESYMLVDPVSFALNDGNIFRQYCVKTLGIPERQVKYLPNATGNQIKGAITWLKNTTEVFDKPEIIIYYAGHGIPDEKTKSAYILPVDGLGNDVTTGYSLDRMYAELSQMPSSRTIVLIDACFTGSKRDKGMIDPNARSVALRPNSSVVQGPLVVLTASQGTETAYPYIDEGHGLFTYFLLKKLQETQGNVTLEELSEYIYTNVRQKAQLEKGTPQTPSVNASSELGDKWKNWKL